MFETKSYAGQTVTLRYDARGFYYFTAPWGSTRTFATKRAALNFARRAGLVVVVAD